MRDIVETIQAEQDEVIRADLGGVLVVQGGPGTGKTAVALHRAAYLLYTHRRELSTPGVLIVGPNADVPALHLAGAALAGRDRRAAAHRSATCTPGCRARRAEPAAVAEIKGRRGDGRRARRGGRRPAAGARRAVRGGRPWTTADRCDLEPRRLRRPRERARRSGQPHNLARPVFDTRDHRTRSPSRSPSGSAPTRTRRPARRRRRARRPEPAGRGRPGRDPPRAARRTPRCRPRSTGCGRCSPRSSCCADLYASPSGWPPAAPRSPTPSGRCCCATRRRRLDAGRRAAAGRGRRAARRGRRVAAARPRRRAAPARSTYAEGVLEIAPGSRVDRRRGRGRAGDPAGHRPARRRAAAPSGTRTSDRLTAAERAAADRTWAFGHVIVDEAQELSPMAWRLLMRRCPSRSMTVVGDVAQTGDLAGAGVLGAGASSPYVARPLAAGRADRQLPHPGRDHGGRRRGARAGSTRRCEPPRSVRETGVPPWRLAVPARAGGVAWSTPCTGRRPRSATAGSAVIVPAGLVDELGAAVAGAPCPRRPSASSRTWRARWWC